MKSYTSFANQREAFWSEFTARLTKAREEPRSLTFEGLESLAVDYRRVLQDHAHAQAAYPGSAASRRLGSLAIEATHFLFADSASERFSLRRFFSELFPNAMRAHTPYMMLCLALFASSILMAYSASTIQPAIGTQLLGKTAIENLERGELWTESLTRVVPASISSSSIATNNMSVAITGWVGGALFGLGAVYVVLTNGFLLGAVFGTTTRFGMTEALLEFIAAHGPLELTLILVSAGHGLAMGHALLAPHDQPREKALKAAARQSMIGLVGILPWFLLLGFVEGFISPSSSVTVPVKVALGACLLSAFLITGYFPSGKKRKDASPT